MKPNESQSRFIYLKLEREKLFRNLRMSQNRAKLLVQLMDIDDEMDELVRCMNQGTEVYTKSKDMNEEVYG